jgi:hypothetical protein
MRTPLITVAILATALATSGTASAKVTKRYTSSLSTAAMSTDGGYPGQGGKAVLAGTWDVSPFGSGAVIDHITMGRSMAPGVLSFVGTERDLLPKGALYALFSGTATIRPDGSVAISARGAFQGGTGLFRGAAGTFTYTGVTPAGSSITSGRSTGAITY